MSSKPPRGVRKSRTIAALNYLMVLQTAITAERKARGLSIVELAERAQVSPSFLANINSGQGNPSLELLAAIAAALDVPLSKLFERDASIREPDRHRPGESEVLPAGFRRVNYVLPERQAQLVEKWGVACQQRLAPPQPATQARRRKHGSTDQ